MATGQNLPSKTQTESGALPPTTLRDLGSSGQLCLPGAQ